MDADAAAAHPLDRAVRLDRKSEDIYLGATSAEYWNMAGPFGGITAAILLKAVMDHPRRRGRPLAQTVNFCAAITPGSFEVRVGLVRDGRSTQHRQVMLLQGDVVAATASLVSGPSRKTWSHQPASPPAIAPFDAVPIFATAGRSAWVGRYEMRFELGAPSRDHGSSDQPASAKTRLWIRDDPPRPLDYVALSALADSFIVRILQVRGDLPPVATVTLSTYFTADEAELLRQGSRSIVGVADARSFKHGFNDQSAELWSDDGDLLAVSLQLVWFKS